MGKEEEERAENRTRSELLARVLSATAILIFSKSAKSTGVFGSLIPTTKARAFSAFIPSQSSGVLGFASAQHKARTFSAFILSQSVLALPPQSDIPGYTPALKTAHLDPHPINAQSQSERLARPATSLRPTDRRCH